MSETGKVWILLGDAGEYSDHTEWIVAAYATEADARADCECLNEIVRAADAERGASPDGEDDWEAWWQRSKAIAERVRAHDAEFSEFDTRYSVAEVALYTASRFPARRRRDDE